VTTGPDIDVQAARLETPIIIANLFLAFMPPLKAENMPPLQTAAFVHKLAMTGHWLECDMQFNTTNSLHFTK
jgi:hypothetical protein